MLFSAGKIIQHIDSVQKECDSLIRDYQNSTWNDKVYKSFEQYNNLCKRSVVETKNLADNCHRICNMLNSLNIEEKEKAAADAMAKVDKLVSDAMNLCGVG